MSVFDASQLMFNNPSFYNGVATQSLNINGNGYLSIQHDTAPTLATKGTVAFWIKLHNNDDRNYVINTTGGSSNNTTMDIRFGGSNTNDGMHIGQYGRTPYTASTTGPKQRDLSAWYHCLVSFDSTSSTASERQMKIFINGVQVTAGTFGAISQNDLFPFTQQTHAIRIGRHISVGYYLDAYLADFYIIDGQALTPDSFTEIKKGICIPKAYEGTYGNNGIRLEFKGTGTATSSGVVSSPTNIGDDSSGNNNHFAVTTLSAHDSNMPDSPENNYATWNRLFRGGEQSSSIYANSTLSEGNLQVSVPTNSYMGSTFRPTSGKWYVEIRVKTIGSANGEIDWGWIQATEYSGSSGHSGQANKWGAFYHAYSTDHIRLYDETTQLGSNINLTISAGNILQLAWDIDNGKGWIGINNTWYRTNATDGNPSAGTNETFTFTADEAQNLQVYIANGTSTDVHTVNFGQDSTFGGAVSAGGNADANGEGDFAYAPPTNFLACCSANLADTTLSPNQAEQANDHFNTLLYTGNSTNNRAITGLGFQPDWVWIKKRNATMSHFLVDSSRGLASNGTGNGNFRQLATNFVYHEEDTGNNSSDGGMASFDADGFTLGKGSNDASADTAYQRNNANSSTYVAWNWKANGGTKTTVSIGDISSGVPSIASEVQANTKAGFSIVLYTGTGASSGTIAHGLGAVPKQIWVKNRDAAYNWKVYHAKNTSAPETDYLVLDTTDATADNVTHWNDTAPDANVFTIGSSNGLIRNNDKYVAYCFTEIEGYSKFGSYTGNGSTDGTFVFTGFRPAFVLGKSSSSSGDNWFIFDNKRDVDNVVGADLNPDSSAAEATSTYMDFVSNGFKLRATSGLVNDATSFIYMAFAEAPFKFANAR
tara:strand:- start:170 stop:2803 length:2634 start_codon:yes stop_codon:yes gene_type:complete